MQPSCQQKFPYIFLFHYFTQSFTLKSGSNSGIEQTNSNAGITNLKWGSGNKLNHYHGRQIIELAPPQTTFVGFSPKIESSSTWHETIGVTNWLCELPWEFLWICFTFQSKWCFHKHKVTKITKTTIFLLTFWMVK